MAKNRRYRWRGFGEQARKGYKPPPAPDNPPVASRNKPATGKQVNFLRNLRRRRGLPIQNLEKLSRADASAEIDKLLRHGTKYLGGQKTGP